MTRPTLRGEVRTVAGDWVPVAFLVDTGADRTILHAGLADLLGFNLPAESDRMSGAGGGFDSARVPTRLNLFNSHGLPVPINGPFTISLDPAAPDGSLLGRDVLNLFAVVIDHSAGVVDLVSGRHRYAIQEA